MRKIKFILIILVLLMFSCEKTLEFDFPETESLPVVNALFSDVDGMKLSLTRSFPMNDLHMDYELLDAEVFLLENNACVDTLEKDTTYYLSDHTLLPGNDYGIIANCEEFGEIRVENSIPETPVIFSAEIIDSVFIELDGSVISQLVLEFEDDPGTKDYYELYLFKHFAYDNYGVLDDDYWVTGFSTENDPILMNENLLEFEPRAMPFSDELFPEGNSCVLRANFHKTSFTEIEKFQLVYVLRHVTYDYYMFKKQSIKHYANQSSDFIDGVGQSVQMYSNVKNGLGIFAGYSQIMDSVYWEE